MSSNFQICNNCNEKGHSFYNCKYPITSYGIIVFKIDNDGKIKYLLICRKNSLGYVDFIRGKYLIKNIDYIRHILDEITDEERENIVNKEFDELWLDLWGDNTASQYRKEEQISKEKFNILKKGILGNDNKEYNLKDLVDGLDTSWKDPEWGFPKGRRNYKENNIMCALREFQEETGYSMNDVNIIQNVNPYEEIFTGSNFKSYKHSYFVGYMNTNSKPIQQFQNTEVSKMEWLTYEDACKHIRPYNLEKLAILKKVNKMLTKYQFI